MNLLSSNINKFLRNFEMKKNLLVALLMLCFVFAGVFAQEAEVMAISEDSHAVARALSTQLSIILLFSERTILLYSS